MSSRGNERELLILEVFVTGDTPSQSKCRTFDANSRSGEIGELERRLILDALSDGRDQRWLDGFRFALVVAAHRTLRGNTGTAALAKTEVTAAVFGAGMTGGAL
jgi:hypothetical protein